MGRGYNLFTGSSSELLQKVGRVGGMSRVSLAEINGISYVCSVQVKYVFLSSVSALLYHYKEVKELKKLFVREGK